MSDEIQKWEYIVREVDNTFSSILRIGNVRYESIQEFLNFMGNAGWEYCGGDSRNIQFVFKRPKTLP